MTDEPEKAWPREIWMAEREDHDQGKVAAYTSQIDGLAEHAYIDHDIYLSAERYYDTRQAELLRRIEALRDWIKDEADARGDSDEAYEVHRQCAFALNEL